MANYTIFHKEHKSYLSPYMTRQKTDKLLIIFFGRLDNILDKLIIFIRIEMTTNKKTIKPIETK